MSNNAKLYLFESHKYIHMYVQTDTHIGKEKYPHKNFCIIIKKSISFHCSGSSNLNILSLLDTLKKHDLLNYSQLRQEEGSPHTNPYVFLPLVSDSTWLLHL